MKQLKLQKTDTGYILHLGGWQKAKILLGGLLLFAFGVFCAFFPWLARDGAAVWDFQAFFCLALGVFGVVLGGYILYIYVGLRVVIDGSGVRRYRFNRCIFDMPWKHVKSWGVTSIKTKVKYHTAEQFYLYFSSVAGERTGKNCITVPMDSEEKGELRRSGLYDFISAHRGEDVDDGYL